MNPIDAVRLMSKHYPGGADALAILVGKSGETLRKEMANSSGYKLGVIDACTISEACIAIKSEHCHAFANAVAASCGGFVQLPVIEADSASLRADLANVVKEAADVLTSGTVSLSDGNVSDNDYKAVSRELEELLEAVQKAQQDLDAAHKAGKVRRIA
jgi:hypothetical protein